MPLRLSVLAVRVCFGLCWLFLAFRFGSVDAWRGGQRPPHDMTWGMASMASATGSAPSGRPSFLARRLHGGRWGGEAPSRQRWAMANLTAAQCSLIFGFLRPSRAWPESTTAGDECRGISLCWFCVSALGSVGCFWPSFRQRWCMATGGQRPPRHDLGEWHRWHQRLALLVPVGLRVWQGGCKAAGGGGERHP